MSRETANASAILLRRGDVRVVIQLVEDVCFWAIFVTGWSDAANEMLL